MNPRSALAAAACGLALAGCGGNADRPQQSPPAAEPSEAIAFASARDGDFDVYVMRPDGSGARNLTRNASTEESEADDDSPAWSPDGTLIAFTSTRDHEGDGFEDQEIYVMAADGSGQRRLTNDARSNAAPWWTQDGRIAFTACGARGLLDCRIDVMEPDGRGRTTLTALTPEIGTYLPAPDGESILFAPLGFTAEGDLETELDIWVMRADGSDRRKLTDARGRDGGPAWSPDGRRIAFLSERDRNGQCIWHDCVGWNPEIYVMNADGSDERRLTNDPGEEGSLDWSPDGTRIVFSSYRDGNDYELYVMNADGTCVTQLTDNGEWDWSPDWSGPPGEGTGPLRC